MNTAWILAPQTPEQAQALADELSISPIVAQILINRGYDSTDSARAFLSPSLHDLRDPFTLPDMDKAVARICQAIVTEEHITIYGDYDVDGMTSTAILLRYLQAIGVTADYYIPHRQREGYGMNLTAINTLAERGTQLIITVDNGSTALDAIAHAKSRGIDVVVTDHHEVQEISPEAVAIVNPKRDDSTYGFTGLCGAGIAFALVMALRKTLRETAQDIPEPNLKSLLDLVAVGTVADLVPLQEDNRIFASIGLQQLSYRPHTGLAALMDVAKTPRDQLSAYHIGFQIGPRLNAAGRMGDARLGVELLTTDDSQVAARLAAQLDQLNAERRAVEQGMIDSVESMLASDPSLLQRSSIVMGHPEWPAGVIGIAAGRIAEKYRLPTILVSLESDPGRGSGRTVGDFPLLDCIKEASTSLQAFGGHSAAAGVTLSAEALAQFTQDFDAAATRMLTSEHRTKRIHADAALRAEDITLGLAHDIAALGPFGMSNPEPCFQALELGVQSQRIVGKNHLKLSFADGPRSIDAIAFGMGEHDAAQAPTLNAAFILEENIWNGRSKVQMRVRDIQSV